MTVNKFFLPVLTLLALFGSYAIARLTGDWSVSGKQTITVEQMTSGADVRGWMTLEQLSTGFGIPLDELYALTGIPAGTPPETALKEMEQVVPGFEVSQVRLQINAWLAGGEPPAVESQPTTPAPTPAATPEPTIEHQSQGDGSGTGPTPLPPGMRLPAAEIKGRHTLQEIADQCQVSLPELLKILGLPENTNPATTVKTLVGQGNITEIQTIRDAVASLQP